MSMSAVIIDYCDTYRRARTSLTLAIKSSSLAGVSKIGLYIDFENQDKNGTIEFLSMRGSF